ncbi:hypothetical protein, partial [Bacillus altitudinis]
CIRVFSTCFFLLSYWSRLCFQTIKMFFLQTF